MNSNHTSDGSLAQAAPVDTTQVVMRLPNLARTEQAAPTTAPESAGSESTPPIEWSLDWKHPIVIQSAIAVGCVLLVIIAWFILSSLSGGPADPPETNNGEMLVDAATPDLQKPGNAFEQPLDAIADHGFQPLPPEVPFESKPSTVQIAPKPQDKPFDIPAPDQQPQSDPVDSIQLNAPGESPRPEPQPPMTNSPALAEHPPADPSYPQTNPKRWRYPEYEIRTPIRRDIEPPRFAERPDRSLSEPHQSTPPWERR